MTSTTFAFGTYIPGSSPVHNMNAQVKIVLACVFSIAVFFVGTWPGLLVMCAAVLACFALARIPLRHAWRGLRPVLVILAFTVLAHVFTFGGSAELAGSLGLTQELELGAGVALSLDGLFRGLFFALRIGLVVLVCSLLTFSSSMLQIKDGLYALLRPLRVLHVPVEDVCTIVSLALRLIPTTAEEAATVADAHRARAASLDGGGVVRRVRAWGGVLSPLFVRLFKRADDLARAMDARCYSGERRTHMHSTRVKGAEIVVAILLAALVIAWCVFA